MLTTFNHNYLKLKLTKRNVFFQTYTSFISRVHVWKNAFLFIGFLKLNNYGFKDSFAFPYYLQDFLRWEIWFQFILIKAKLIILYFWEIFQLDNLIWSALARCFRLNMWLERFQIRSVRYLSYRFGRNLAPHHTYVLALNLVYC